VADDLAQTRTALLDLGHRRRDVAERLARVRAALERRRQEALERRARIFQVCPVEGSTFGRSFGVLSTRGTPHIHQGIDAFAAYGTPVRAPFAGTARVSTNPIGGLAVTVDGTGGFVYNAHLAAIGTTGPVAAGTVIGWVGTSGNARGTSPHDHLEWHPGGGPAADPFDLLTQAC
jgi:murein DD-endopeptidase MepM/ murein hydrolase activator NlpD